MKMERIFLLIKGHFNLHSKTKTKITHPLSQTYFKKGNIKRVGEKKRKIVCVQNSALCSFEVTFIQEPMQRRKSLIKLIVSKCYVACWKSWSKTRQRKKFISYFHKDIYLCLLLPWYPLKELIWMFAFLA